MKWLIFPLVIQTMAGIALASRALSFNMWEPNEGVRKSGGWLSIVTGVVLLASAGLGWYKYEHGLNSCWGFSGLGLLKLCLDAVSLVLLYFVLFRKKSAPPSEPIEVD